MISWWIGDDLGRKILVLIVISDGRIWPFVWISINWVIVCWEGIIVSYGISTLYALNLGAKKLLYYFSLKIKVFFDPKKKKGVL
jgi:hypothetical protein